MLIPAASIAVDEQRVDRRETSAEGVSASAAQVSADGAARPRRVADDVLLSSTLGAAADVRQVAREPEQFQLERKAKRIELGARRTAVRLVEEIEEAGDRHEDAVVSLLLREEVQHGLGADEADRGTGASSRIAWCERRAPP